MALHLTCCPPSHVLGDLRRQLAAAAGPGAAAAAAAGRPPHAGVHPLGEAASDDDYLRLALSMKVGMREAPLQSGFRVVAILRYRDSAGVERYMGGTNIEAGSWVGNSLCAERSAMSLLRLVDCSGVSVVYVVSDMIGAVVTPGVMCRELLCCNLPQDTPVVMGSADGPLSTEVALRKKSTVGELYPLGDVMARAVVANRLPRADMQGWADSFAARCQRAPAALPRSPEWGQVFSAASAASASSTGNDWHPLKLGAAVGFSDGSVESSAQAICIEYGNTVCPVSRLQEFIERRRRQGVRAVVLLQVDQRGLLHAPFAAARAYLTEHGYGDCQTAAHEMDGAIRVVPVSSLVADPPAWNGRSSHA
eukprot:TRINITY_DN55143_c0_g1_i1.p1 TRINITY_DN55143_c0_g1~~TRINITY_DN55143_c0_g1_i1.p1  ORF type:complete len:401 (+),score=129.63 TRINITY_DN55143_c0_g1_i1:112-1203(+)